MRSGRMKIGAVGVACLATQGAQGAAVAKRQAGFTKRQIFPLPTTTGGLLGPPALTGSPGVGDQFSFTIPSPTSTIPPFFSTTPIFPTFSSFTFPFVSSADPTTTDDSTTSTPTTSSTSSSSSTSTTPSTTSTSSTSTTPTTTSTSSSSTETSSTTPTPDPTTSSSTFVVTVPPSSSSALPSASLAANTSSGLSKGTRTGIIGGSVVGGLLALGLILWLGTCLTRRRSNNSVDKIAIDFDPARHGGAGPLYRNSRMSTTDGQRSGTARHYAAAAGVRNSVLRRPSSRRKPPPRVEDLQDDDAKPEEHDPRELAEVAWDHPVTVPASRPSVSRHSTPASGSGGVAGARSLRNYTSRPPGDSNAYISAIPPYPPRPPSDESNPSFNSGRPSVFGRDPGWQGQQHQQWQPEHRTWGSQPRMQHQGQWEGDEQGVLPEEDVYGGTTEDTLRRAMRGPSSYPSEATPGHAVV